MPSLNRARPRHVGLLPAALILALAVRVLYLFAGYVLGWPGAQRFKVETWTLIFVAAGIAWRWVRSRRVRLEPARSPSIPVWLWPGACGVALALYWPALSVGFLSDDYVLLPHALAWNIGPVTASLFRPVPMFAWALLLHAGAGARALHLFNVLLHGTNAYLTARVVSGWVDDRRWSVAAAFLMLTAPLASEAVVWLSGVFDLMATALVLASILLARRYADRATLATRMQFLAAGLAAIASKETAVVGGGFVLLDAWARRAAPRRLLVDTGALLGVAAVFSLARLASAFGVSRPPLTKYLVQRAVFGAFGGLAVPWHRDLVAGSPWLPIAGVAAILLLLAVFFVERGAARRDTRLAGAAAAWILLGIVPVFPILFVAPDLQQARYLYLPAAGWAALVAVVASGRRRGTAIGLAAHGAVVALVAMAAYGTMFHVRPWREAAALRDGVERAARGAGMDACSTIMLSDLPDSVRGAYVFRNGGAEAFARDLDLNARVGDGADGPCAFRWDDRSGLFVRTAGE